MKHVPASVVRAAAAILLSAIATAAPGVTFNNGLVNDIDAPLLGGAGGATVLDSDAGATTTLNALSGAVINGITADDSSIVNVFAGSSITVEVMARGMSDVNVFGGSLATLDAEHSSEVEIAGGLFSVAAAGRYVGAFDDAIVYILGGDFSAGGTTDAVQANEQSTVEVRGGLFDGDFDANHDAMLTIRGGSGISGVTATEQALIEIYGLEFTITGLGPIDLATPFVIDDDAHNGETLGGTLADGSAINAEIFNGIGDSQIVLRPVPLPAAVWLLGSGLLGVLGASRARMLRAGCSRLGRSA